MQQFNQQPIFPGQPPNSVMMPPVSNSPNQQQNSRNGPIYVPSNVSKVNQQPMPPNPNNMYQQQVSQAPPAPQMINNYVQSNGGYGNPAQYVAQIVSIFLH